MPSITEIVRKNLEGEEARKIVEGKRVENVQKELNERLNQEAKQAELLLRHFNVEEKLNEINLNLLDSRGKIVSHTGVYSFRISKGGYSDDFYYGYVGGSSFLLRFPPEGHSFDTQVNKQIIVLSNGHNIYTYAEKQHEGGSLFPDHNNNEVGHIQNDIHRLNVYNDKGELKNKDEIDDELNQKIAGHFLSLRQ